MKIKRLALACLTTSFLVFSAISLQAQDSKNGRKLFKANCATCHKPDAKFTGPALQGWKDRVPPGDWIYKWVKNSTALIGTGDQYANKIYQEYDGTPMNTFDFLTNEQIDDILAYVDNYPNDEPKDVAVTTTTTGGEDESGASPVLLLIILIILIVLSFILSRVVMSLDRVVAEKMGDPVPDIVPVHKQLFNVRVKAALVILALMFGGWGTFKVTSGFGRQQGYEPNQPIKFSHALHAGQNKIDCQYCHSGAWKSKNALIPSSNVCMNCHKVVKEGPKYGTKEIAKVYEYAGWDPDSGRYVNDGKPIEWIKIHNLPDHVFFSHAQHVNAGGIECQTCHGQIQEMEVVHQEANLGMGWCVNCHRQTDVNFNNEYYSTYTKLHEQLKNKEIKTVTAESIGATECQKCHY